jgi:hypothetical protein
MYSRVWRIGRCNHRLPLRTRCTYFQMLICRFQPALKWVFSESTLARCDQLISLGWPCRRLSRSADRLGGSPDEHAEIAGHQPPAHTDAPTLSPVGRRLRPDSTGTSRPDRRTQVSVRVPRLLAVGNRSASTVSITDATDRRRELRNPGKRA